MKKLSMLLVFVLLFSVFYTSCGEVGQDDSIGDESADSSLSSPDTDINKEKFDPVYKTVISIGCTYKTSHPADDAYPDSFGAELTDGIFAAEETGYSDSKLSGYTASALDITVDLGEVKDKIYSFETAYLATTSAGISPPASVFVRYSIDGENWQSAGSAVKPEYKEDTIQSAVLTLDKYVQARYVKFTITKGSAWLFLTEVSVFADIEAADKNLEFLDKITQLYAKDDKTHQERLSELKKVSGDSVDRTQNKIYVSKGKGYTLSLEPDTARYSNPEGKLTDGRAIDSIYESGDWVGFKDGKALEITLDLGKEYEDLADFEISFFNNYAADIALPDYVLFCVSSDNSNYTDIGMVYGPANREYDSFNFAFRAVDGIKGRYVRFCIPESDYEWYLIEEAAVFRYESGEKETDWLYPNIALPVISKEEFWSSSEKDYSKTINLLRGLSPQIMSAVPLGSEAAEYNSSITAKMLTDGVYSPNNDIHNGRFFKFNKGAHRDVIFDLGKTSSVQGFTASFVNHKSWGVLVPPKVLYYLSDDGSNWYKVGESSFLEVEEIENVKVELKLKSPIKARFVRFGFDVNVWAGCDELEVMGTKKITSGTKALADINVSSIKFLAGEYQQTGPEVLGGVKDILLSYHVNYGSSNPNAGLITVEEYMPYVAYMDKEGNILDVMFDGYLYLPSGGMPSGGKSHENNIKSDWEYVLNNIFTEGRNIYALEEAAGIVKDKLGLGDDYKYKVYIALMYPSQGIVFGDIDGDGNPDTLTDTATRVKVIEWYAKEFFAKYEAAGFENLEFCGFYWHHESLQKTQEELDLTQGVSNYVHSLGYQLFWIPYYTASGYNQYKDYGFDVANMQPNYAFKESTPISYLHNCATLAKLYNMGVEMEIDSQALSKNIFYRRWMEYLKFGVTYGYIDSLHMYYQGGMPGAFYLAYHSEDSKTRLIYDYTYDFIKGTLKIKPDVVEDKTFNTKPGEMLTDSLAQNTNSNINRFVIDVSPANGTVTIDDSGQFVYFPYKGFEGTDTFTYRYSEQLDYSDPCVVNITVGK